MKYSDGYNPWITVIISKLAVTEFAARYDTARCQMTHENTAKYFDRTHLISYQVTVVSL